MKEEREISKNIRLVLPYPATPAQRKNWAKWYGLNAYWAGKHWANRKRDAEFWHEFVAAELRRQRIPKKPYTRPVRIDFAWNDRMDIDNHAVMAKLIVDAMRGWVHENDSRRWYAACSHRFHDKDYILVEVTQL